MNTNMNMNNNINININVIVKEKENINTNMNMNIKEFCGCFTNTLSILSQYTFNADTYYRVTI